MNVTDRRQTVGRVMTQSLKMTAVFQEKTVVFLKPHEPIDQHRSPFPQPSATHQLTQILGQCTAWRAYLFPRFCQLCQPTELIQMAAASDTNQTQCRVTMPIRTIVLPQRQTATPRQTLLIIIIIIIIFFNNKLTDTGTSKATDTSGNIVRT